MKSKGASIGDNHGLKADSSGNVSVTGTGPAERRDGFRRGSVSPAVTRKGLESPASSKIAAKPSSSQKFRRSKRDSSGESVENESSVRRPLGESRAFRELARSDDQSPRLRKRVESDGRAANSDARSSGLDHEQHRGVPAARRR